MERPTHKTICNEVADRVAKLALDLNGEHLWRDFIPLCIQEIVMVELHVF